LTNRINGQTYDANGNWGSASSFDIENRLAVGGSYLYTYDGANKRVAKSAPMNYNEDGDVSGEELFMFYGAGGERLAEFTLSIVKYGGSPWQYYLKFTEKDARLVRLRCATASTPSSRPLARFAGGKTPPIRRTPSRTPTTIPTGKRSPARPRTTARSSPPTCATPKTAPTTPTSGITGRWGGSWPDPYQASAGAEIRELEPVCVCKGDPVRRIDRLGLADED
jgi:hypothetical protein